MLGGMPPPPFDSMPRRARPGARTAIVLSALCVGAALLAPRSIPAMAGLAALSGAFCLAAGGAGALGGVARRLVPLVLLVVVLNGLVAGGEPVVAVAGRKVLSREGLVAGVFFALRLAAMVLALAALVAAAPPEAIARALHTFLRPFSGRLAEAVAFHGFIASSFVPLFRREFERVRLAQSFRGADLGGGPLRRARAARALVVPLLLSAIRRAEQLALVVELRGLRARIARGR
ncbi:MAG: hypothetical protein OEO21_00600 [Candidatus Krumholzibacteria bacterium]|nr:hypothetical protein [Candidatus Krumholzibacteria bacterium]